MKFIGRFVSTVHHLNDLSTLVIYMKSWLPSLHLMFRGSHRKLICVCNCLNSQHAVIRLYKRYTQPSLLLSSWPLQAKVCNQNPSNYSQPNSCTCTIQMESTEHFTLASLITHESDQSTYCFFEHNPRYYFIFAVTNLMMLAWTIRNKSFRCSVYRQMSLPGTLWTYKFMLTS